MNRIYSKVWNASLTQWVVASELASSGGKGSATGSSSGVRRCLAKGLVLAIALACAGTAAAQSTQDWKIQANNDTPTQVAAGDTVQLKDGQNIVISRNGTDITIAVAASPDFSGADMGGGKITTVGDGSVAQGSADAVNGGQLYDVQQTAQNANQGWNVSVNGGTAQTVAPGGTVNFADDGQNIAITRTGNQIKVSMAPTPSFSGADMGSQKITHVAAGNAATDAVNKSQLDAVQTVANTAASGWNVKVNNGTATNVAPGDNVNFVNGSNVEVTQSGTAITIAMAPTPSFSGADMGNQKITGVAAGSLATDAVNKGQLEAVQAVAASGWNLKVNGGTATNVAPGDSVNFVNGSNVEVTQSGTDVTVAVAPTPQFDGADMGSKKITHVAAGTLAAGSADAVNGGQLYETNTGVAEALGTTVDANGKLVQPTYNVAQGDGSSQSFDNVKDAVENITGANGGTGVGIKYFHATSAKPDSQALGIDSIAIGPNTVVAGKAGLAAGDGASIVANATAAVALGQGALIGANSDNAIAVGTGANTATDANDSVAMGTGAQGVSANAVAIGSATRADASAVAVGNGSSAATSALGVGNGATAGATDSIALGSGAQALTHDSISLGTGAGQGTVYKVPDDGKRHSHIAIGEDAGQNVAGNETIAIGVGAGSGVTNDYNVAIGSHAGTNINGERNVALGYQANQQASEIAIEHAVSIGGKTQARTNGVALGYLAQANNGGVAIGESSGADSHGVAIGQAAEADAGFIALGQNSIASSADVVGNGYLTGAGFAGTAVSVGNSQTGLYRRITNVADGSQDHDAVTVAQLKALKVDLGSFTPTSGGNANYNSDGTLSVADAATDGEAVSLGQMNQTIADNAVKYFSVDPNGDTSNRDNAGAVGDNSMAIGHAAQTQGKSSLAMGHEARVSQSDQATSVGYATNVKADNGTAIGSASTVDDEAGVAVGRKAYSRGENSLAMGTDAQTGAQNSGTATSDNAIAFGTSSRATNDDASAMGHGATATGKKSTAIGFAAHAENATSAFATGTNALANAENAHAAGTGAVASNTNAFASGTGAHAAGTDSIASGTGALANTANAIAVGHNAASGFSGDAANNVSPTSNTIAIGNSSTTVYGQGSLAVGNGNVIGAENASDPTNVYMAGNYSGAFGNHNTINEDNNFVVGSNNTIAKGSEVENTFVLGSNVSPTQANSVVLGNASKDRAATTETGAHLYGTDRTFAGAGDESFGVVSVGAKDAERQIINVAAGKISADSTDAVNGSQLYQTNQAMDDFAGDMATYLGGGAGHDPGGNVTQPTYNVLGTDYHNVGDAIAAATTHYYSVNDGGTQGANYNDDGATATNALAAGVGASATGTSALAVGDGSQALEGSSIAIGDTATANSTRDIAMGSGATTGPISGATANQLDSVAIGSGAQALGGTGIAIGSGAVATGSGTTFTNSAIAIGRVAKANDYSAVALGDNASTGAGANHAAAIGSGAQVGEDAYSAVAIGAGADVADNAYRATAIGSNAKVLEGAALGVAIGRNAMASKDQSVAIGPNATATNSQDVAIGADSVTAAPSTGPYTVTGDTGTIAGTSNTTGVVSVGTSTHARQIQNVAAGTVSATSTDAVNGSQLYTAGTAINNLGSSTATNLGGGSTYDSTTGKVSAPSYTVLGNTYNNVGSALDAATVHYFSVNDGGTQGGNYNNDGATGSSALAAGVNAKASEDDTIALGHDATASGQGAVALGDSASAAGAQAYAQGQGAKAVYDGDVAIGRGADTTTPNASSMTSLPANDTAIGSNAKAQGGGSLAMGYGSLATGTSTTGTNNAVALGSLSQALDYNTTAVGVSATVDAGASNGVAVGASAVVGSGADSGVAVGANASVGDNALDATAIGASAQANANGASALGSSSDASGDFSTAVGNDSHATDEWAAAVGVGSHATGSKSIAVGHTEASGDDAISIGTSTRDITKPVGQQFTVGGAFGDRSIAIGKDVRAAGDYSLAMGNDGATGADAEGAHSIALGGASVAGTAGNEEAIAIGHGAQATGKQSIAIGTGNVVSGANSGAFGDPNTVSGTGSYAFGNGNTVANDNTFVLGNGVTTTQDNSVVLGNGSTDGAVHAGTTAMQVTLGGTTYTYAGPASAAAGMVSVGTSGAERQIQNVAAGDVTATSTDAVNGSQLYATNQAIDAVSTVANTGWNVGVNGGTAAQVKPGDNVDFSNTDSNVKIAKTDSGTDHDITVDLADDISVDSVTAGDSKLDTDGLSVDDGAGNKTTVTTAGTTVTDASGNTTTVASTGTAIDDGAGNSVTTTSTGTTMTDGTNTTTYGADGLAVTGGPTISSAGIDVAGKKITHVADGAVSATSTDAVNGSQLYDVQQTANAGWNVGVNGGTAAQVKPGDNVDFSNTDSNVKIAKTDSGTDHDITVDLADDISVDSVTAGDSKLDTDGLSVDDGAGNKTTVTTAGTTVTDASGNTTTVASTGTTIDDGAGNSVTTTSTGTTMTDGTNTTTYGADGLAVTGGPTISSAGIDAGSKKITNVADGAISTSSTDAVNGSQLQAAGDSLAGDVLGGNAKYDGISNSYSMTNIGGTGKDTIDDAIRSANDAATAGWNVADGAGNSNNIGPKGKVTFTGDSSNVTVTESGSDDDAKVQVALNDDISVDSVKAGDSKLDTDGLTVDDGSGNVTTTGATGTTVTDAGGNTTAVASTGTTITDGTGNTVTTTATGTTMTDGTHTSTYGADGVAITGGPTISSAGIDAGDKKITSVADGEVSATSTDAVNGSQLNATNVVVKNLGDSAVTVLGGNAAYDDATGTLSMSDIGGTGKDNINDAIASANDAATAGWNLTAQGANSTNVGPNDAVDLNNSDGNIVVSKSTTSNDVTFDLAKDIAVDSVSLGSDVKLDTTGLLIVGGPSITVAGIDAGNLKITHVAPGTDPTDAVNKSQLDNVSDQVQQLAANAVQYDDSSKGKVTLGGPTSTDGGKTGGTKISNVHRGDVSANSTDAVNGSQLYETNQKVADNSDAIQNIQNGQGGYFQVKDSSGKGKPAATGKDSTAGGAGAVASGDQSTAVGSGAKATGKGSVAVGAGSVASRDDAVSVGSEGHERQVTNVAPGTESTDAVNVGQLNGAVESAKSWAQNYTDKRFDTVNRNMNVLGHRVDAGVASAMAMASMPQAYAPNQSAAAVGLGQFHGEVGVAVGLSTITDSGRYVFKLNASGNTRGDVGVGVGAAVVW